MPQLLEDNSRALRLADADVSGSAPSSLSRFLVQGGVIVSTHVRSAKDLVICAVENISQGRDLPGRGVGPSRFDIADHLPCHVVRVTAMALHPGSHRLLAPAAQIPQLENVDPYVVGLTHDPPWFLRNPVSIAPITRWTGRRVRQGWRITMRRFSRSMNEPSQAWRLRV